jgi:hypothetical protein
MPMIRIDRTAFSTLFRETVVALICVLAAACSQQSFLEAMTSPEDRALSQVIIQALQSGDRAMLIKYTQPELVSKIDPVLPQMRAVVPAAGPGTAFTLVDASFASISPPGKGTIKRSFLAYEVDGRAKHALVQLGFERNDDGKVWLIAIYARGIAKPIWELTAFTLSGKSDGQYFFLLMTVLSTIAVVGSLVVLNRARGVSRKWLWAVSCLFGFGQFTMDWATGMITFQPVAVQLFGAIVSKAGIGPWRIGFGVPLFAIWFLLAEQRRLARVRAEGGPGASVE